MVFIREHEQLAWNLPRLQNVERSQALRDWKSIIELVVDGLNTKHPSVST